MPAGFTDDRPGHLSILLIGVVLYAGNERCRSPTVAWLSVLTAAGGLYFIWTPDHATRVAQWSGVGRGVDLVLYIWVCITLIVLLNLHLKLRTQMEIITILARTIALSDVHTRPSENSNPCFRPARWFTGEPHE